MDGDFLSPGPLWRQLDPNRIFFPWATAPLIHLVALTIAPHGNAQRSVARGRVDIQKSILAITVADKDAHGPDYLLGRNFYRRVRLRFAGEGGAKGSSDGNT
jgi:hypothetical protein